MRIELKELAIARLLWLFGRSILACGVQKDLLPYGRNMVHASLNFLNKVGNFLSDPRTPAITAQHEVNFVVGPQSQSKFRTVL